MSICQQLYSLESIFTVINSLDFCNYPHAVNRKSIITSVFSRGIKISEKCSPNVYWRSYTLKTSETKLNNLATKSHCFPSRYLGRGLITFQGINKSNNKR